MMKFVRMVYFANQMVKELSVIEHTVQYRVLAIERDQFLYFEEIISTIEINFSNKTLTTVPSKNCKPGKEFICTSNICLGNR